MEKLIILNHKMNLEYDEVYPYIEKLNQLDTSKNIIVCPATIYLESFVNHSHWGIGAQNVSSKLDGNYTGEVSTLQLKSLGVEYAMIGHYERKKYFHETNKEIREKLNACLDANICPILCFGETGKFEDIVSTLDEVLVGISNIDFIIFAYEPLKVSEQENVDEIETRVEEIYHYLYEKYHSVPNIVYGGGISRKDIREVMNIKNLNGILIGKLSASYERIEKVIKMLDSK